MRANADEQLTSLLVFRAGSAQPKAVRWGWLDPVEEIARRQRSNLQNRPDTWCNTGPVDAAVQMTGVSVQTTGPSRSWCSPDGTDASRGLWSPRSFRIVEERVIHGGGEASKTAFYGSPLIKGQATK